MRSGLPGLGKGAGVCAKMGADARPVRRTAAGRIARGIWVLCRRGRLRREAASPRSGSAGDFGLLASGSGPFLDTERPEAAPKTWAEA